MNFLQLPRLVLPANEDAERLRQKWAERKAELEREAFWAGVQDSKQPILLEEQEDGFLVPRFISEYPIG